MCIDWLNAGKQLRIIEPHIQYLHIDIIDGNFAPDFTMGSSIVNRFREKTSIPFDYHLMVEEPRRFFDAFSIRPGDIFTIHQESVRQLHRDLVQIRRMGAKVGVALAPATHIDTLEYVLDDIDVVLLMTVNPGYKGQPLVPQTIKKVADLKRIIDSNKLNIKISVDGNVSLKNIPEMVTRGADMLVLGSSGLFTHTDHLFKNINLINESIAYSLNGNALDFVNA